MGYFIHFVGVGNTTFVRPSIWEDPQTLTQGSNLCCKADSFQQHELSILCMSVITTILLHSFLIE